MAENPPAIIKRHSRALRILSCLQSGPTFNARELAQRLRVSRRTIYRDLNLLREAGIAVAFDEQHSAYRVDTSRQLTPSTLEPEDLTRLALTSHLSVLSAICPDFEMSIRESMSRLLGPYPAEVRGPIQRILSCCRVRPSETSQAVSANLQRILVGVGRGVHVRLELFSDRGEPLVTRLAPFFVEVAEDGWRVTGRSSRHRGTKTFRLDQVRVVHLTDLPYEVPRGNRTRRAS